MERLIGSIFEQDGKEYIVMDSTPICGCKFCDLYDIKHGCMGKLSQTGDCLKNYRKDRKYVYFKLHF